MPRKSKKSTAVIVVKKGKVARKGRRSGAVGVAAMRSSAAMNCTLEYFKSIVDPFEYGDIKLGWGCMVPTASPQAFFRGSTTASATDGSLTIALLPCVLAGIQIWNTAAGTVNISALENLSNQPAITGNCGEGRVVSIGIRAFPNIALTDSPGVAYSGATVATTYTQLITLATNDFVALPTSHQTIGTKGVSSTGRPIDPESFTFLSPVVDGLGWPNSSNAGKSIPFSVPYVSFLGLPPSAQVFFECVINIEATQVVAHAAQTILADAAPTEGTVGDVWPTPEGLHKKFAPYLPKPGRPGESAASTDAGYLNALWNGLKGVGKAAAPVASFLATTAAQSLLGGGGSSGQGYGSQYGGYRY